MTCKQEANGPAPVNAALGQSHYKDKTKLNKTTILLNARVRINSFRWWIMDKTLSGLLPIAVSFAPGTVEYKTAARLQPLITDWAWIFTAVRYATITQWRPRRVVPLITRGGTNRNTKQNAHSTQFSSQPNCRLHSKCWWRARIPQHHTIM